MDFNQNKPIYLQIADSICEKILSGEYLPDERILSVRELGISLGVNPNTIARVYDHLQGMEVIYNKRGIGYFVAPSAPERILEKQRDEFLREELPAVARKMKLLGVPLEVLGEMMEENK
jgi:DNA-binding transcriptional regulator YhcF (GntR family)